jgi:hypothetical protein
MRIDAHMGSSHSVAFRRQPLPFASVRPPEREHERTPADVTRKTAKPSRPRVRFPPTPQSPIPSNLKNDRARTEQCDRTDRHRVETVLASAFLGTATSVRSVKAPYEQQRIARDA